MVFPNIKDSLWKTIHVFLLCLAVCCLGFICWVFVWLFLGFFMICPKVLGIDMNVLMVFLSAFLKEILLYQNSIILVVLLQVPSALECQWRVRWEHCPLFTLCSNIQRNGQKVNLSRSGVKKMHLKASVLRVSACRWGQLLCNKYWPFALVHHVQLLL